MIDAGTEAAVGLQIETAAQVIGVGSRHDQTQPRPSLRADSFGIRCTDPALPAEAERQRWMACQVRHGADLAWVPESVGSHILKVEWRGADEALVLTLCSGTQIIDRHDEVVALGEPDSTAIALMVACAQRHGWPSAAAHGSEEFRVAAARALLAAGIRVADPPLPADEVAKLLALTASEASGRLASPIRRR
jgi:Large polyvalent protein-associated domain 7